MAKVEYDDGGMTWHGPFATQEAAGEWLNQRLEFDYEDLAEDYDGEVVTLNLVRKADREYLDGLRDELRAGQPYTDPAPIGDVMKELQEAGYLPPGHPGMDRRFEPSEEPIRKMVEHVHDPEHGNSGRYESEAKYQFVDQTDVWAVHFNCPHASLKLVLGRMSRLVEVTGEYLYEGAGTLEDHMAEPDGEHHRLVIYYRAATPERARTVAWHLVASAYFATPLDEPEKSRAGIEYYISTAGDHSAQIPND